MMPDPVTHTQVAAPVFGGALSAAISVIFGIHATAFVAAFIGAWIGAALLPAMSFKKTLINIIVGTVATAYIVPIVFNLWPNFSQVSLAALAGFLLVHFHEFILQLFKDALTRLFGKVGR